MSDVPQGPGWWQASDGRWYPPTATPGTPRPPSVPDPASFGPGPPPYGPGPAPSGYGYGYAPNPNGTPSGLPSVNGHATASLVLGILSLVVCCAPFVLCSLVGLPLGIYALLKINQGAADPGPKGVAIGGVVVNGIGLAILAFFAVVLVAGG